MQFLCHKRSFIFLNIFLFRACFLNILNIVCFLEVTYIKLIKDKIVNIIGEFRVVKFLITICYDFWQRFLKTHFKLRGNSQMKIGHTSMKYVPILGTVGFSKFLQHAGLLIKISRQFRKKKIFHNFVTHCNTEVTQKYRVIIIFAIFIKEKIQIV